jgi:hypothetical protein
MAIRANHVRDIILLLGDEFAISASFTESAEREIKKSWGERPDDGDEEVDRSHS